jgi:hypothetical protein
MAEHGGLAVQGDDPAARPNGLGEGDRQAAGPAASVQHLHARGETQPSHKERGPDEGARERVLDQEEEPGRERRRAASLSQDEEE